MAYRNGTYVAFDGQNTTDPTNSDIRYYNLFKAWAENRRIEFTFVNSHDKTYQVRDSSSRETLENRICERLLNSKNMLVILSSDTRETGSMLSFEIRKAVDDYSIPLIIAYPDVEYAILNPRDLHQFWPNSLQSRINNRTARAIHIPFDQDIIFQAIRQYGVNVVYPKSSLGWYTKETYEQFGYHEDTF